MSKPLIFGSGASSFKDKAGLTQVCEAAVDNGILRFDTAPSYTTEVPLSRALQTIFRQRNIDRNGWQIQTKIDPIQMYQGNIDNYFKAKLKAMDLEYVDVLLLHWPVYKYFRKTWEAMLKLKDIGLAKRLGICNLRIQHLKELQGIGIVPEIIQIERHPLNTFTEEREFCLANGIELQDYSPLCKMHPLLKESPVLKRISEAYGQNVGSVILRWHIDSGTTPIFTSKNVARIGEYSHIDEFSLNETDILEINSLNINHKLYLESLVCPGF